MFNIDDYRSTHPELWVLVKFCRELVAPVGQDRNLTEAAWRSVCARHDVKVDERLVEDIVDLLTPVDSAWEIVEDL